MSEGNVELHRGVVEAFNARDVEALIAYADPSIEFRSAFADMGGVYHGHDGARKFTRDFEDVWGDVRIEPTAYFDLGEHTLAFIVAHGRGRQSGAEVAMLVAHVCRWRDGLIVWFKAYTDREAALGDLDVSEDELEPIEP